MSVVDVRFVGSLVLPGAVRTSVNLDDNTVVRTGVRNLSVTRAPLLNLYCPVSFVIGIWRKERWASLHARELRPENTPGEALTALSLLNLSLFK